MRKHCTLIDDARLRVQVLPDHWSSKRVNSFISSTSTLGQEMGDLCLHEMVT